MNHRHGWRVGIAVLGAAGMVDALHVGCLGARAGDGAPAWARPPAVTRLQPGAGQMLGDLQGAVWMGWLRDPEAVVEGTPVSTWLVRLVSNDPAEAVAARRVLTSLGRGALPWLAIGLGEHAGLRSHDACAELAADLVGAAGVDLVAATTDPRPWMRRVAWAAARRGGLSGDDRKRGAFHR